MMCGMCLCCQAKSVDLQVVPKGNSTPSAGKQTEFELYYSTNNF